MGNKIERVGHLCWFGPHDPPQAMMDTWVKMNPGLIWSVWKDHTGWKNQEQINARAARNEWNGVCDVIRPELLVRYGGIVVDADSECVKPLEEGDFFEQETAIACFESESVRPGMVACGMLGAPRAHPFFEACIEEIAQAPVNEMAWKAVGPAMMTRMAQKHPDLIKVYPAKSFVPTHYSGAVAPGDFPTFAKQYFGSTKGYGSLRRWPCQCKLCAISMLRAPWM